MAKAVKKTRRLKKSVRKTLGALFLASALVVAAVPTGGLKEVSGATTGVTAVDIPRTTKKATVTESDMTAIIPKVSQTDPVYTTGDRTFQFAYVQSGTEYIAIILGFNKSTILENQTLSIPAEVNAYKQFNTNLGTNEGYVAVGRSGNFLFYESVTTTTTTETKKEIVDGVEKDVAYTTTTEHHQLYPCYTDTENIWGELGNEQIYYQPDPSVAGVDSYDNVKVVKEDGTVTSNTVGSYTGYNNTYYDSDFQRLTGAVVRYIGNQTLEQDPSTKEWHASAELIDDEEEGVFYNCSNFSTLEVGKNLQGIGNFAFYGCGALKSITLGDNLRVIGNSAFENCQRLQTVNLNVENLIQKIGDHAFAGCSALLGFDLPISVTSIGDSAFEGCSALTYVDLCSGGSSNQLKELGYDVFKNCTSLKALTFPASFDKKVDISTFVGCTGLERITALNSFMTFGEDDCIDTSVSPSKKVYSLKDFRAQLADGNGDVSFYFEGLTGSSLYTCAKDNFIAFSHIKYNSDTKQYENLDKYELTVDASTNGSGSPTMTYMVNSAGTLIDKLPTGNVTNLKIPNKIGPYGITAIDAGLFQDYCHLETVTIPAAVKSIGANAFKGCHKLRDVIFESGDVSIGAEAFKTQDNGGHELGCTGSMTDSGDNTPAVKLRFTGPISPNSGPFQYAMSYGGRYNNASQNESFIKYYSGWPQNLQVEYVVDAASGVGKATLTDFPSFKELAAGKYNNDSMSTGYAYITDEYETAAKTAYGTAEAQRTENQKAILDAVKNLVIPEGVEDIKAGLCAEKAAADLAASYNDVKTVTSYGLTEIGSNDFAGVESLGEIYIHSDAETIEAEAFKDCTGLKKVEITGNNQAIGDHAFEGCTVLESVAIPASTTTIGVRPFAGCPALGVDADDINFQNNPNFAYENSMIFSTSNGENTGLIECLEGKSGKYVRPDELQGITYMAEEAFADTDVAEVDLSTSMINVVPSLAFENTGSLRTIKLPHTCTTLQDNAFKDSTVEYIEVPNITILSVESFADMKNANSDITLCVTEGSYMEQWATQNGFDVTYMQKVNFYTVVFWDWSEELGKNVIVQESQVQEGMDAVPPEPVGKAGYIFDKWDPDYHQISGYTTCFAQYVTPPEDYGKLKVVFEDYDGTVLDTVYVVSGGDVSDKAPKPPARDGYIFIGWNKELTNITADTTTCAQYEKLEEGVFVVTYIGRDDSIIYTAKVKDGETPPNIAAPAVDGYTFMGWRPALDTITSTKETYAQYESTGSMNGTGGNGTGNGTGNGGNGSTSDNSSATTYTLTVVNGSGSGSYIAGTQPIIVANNPASGMEFASWTVSPSGTKIASTALSATVITMPEGNVTVTANYKKKANTGGSTVSGNITTNRPNGSDKLSNGGTTVVIDKNGLSNTGVVSATVNGSSDNFTIKITESSAASEAVLKALMAEYGSDLSNIKYFPMDISLYDSTGKKLITDTRGLSVTVTLPLPDSQIVYAGNNKVAGVVNNKLDKLNCKFTTINGVSCVTFTAEHFSPYVIYADVSNLSAGLVQDSTPKTGDGIHPKWFLAMGLACVSFVLFMQKDSGKKKKVKVRV